MKKEINILIADDHPIFRSGLKQAIESIENYKVIAEASDGEEALFKIQSFNPDISILDLNIPKLNGFQIAREINEKNISTKIIFLTMHRGEDLLQEAIKLNAKGYVLKESPLHEVLMAIDKVYNGGEYISREITELPGTSFEIKNISNETKLLIQNLTQTEIKILKLIAVQKTSKEIAKELFVSYKTIEKHRSNICDKLNLSGNNALLKFALDHKELIN